MDDCHFECRKIHTRLQFDDYADKSIRPDTRKKYVKIWHDYIDYCQENNWDAFVDDQTSIMAFFLDLANNEATPATLNTASAAIKHFLIMQDRDDFTSTPKFSKFIKGATNPNQQFINKRATNAFSEELMKQIRIACYRADSLVTKRVGAAVVLAYHKYMRISEVHALNLQNTQFHPERDTISMRIKKDKFNPAGYNTTVDVNSPNGRYILYYLFLIGADDHSQGCFLPVVKPRTNTSDQSVDIQRRVSISTLRKNLKELLTDLGINPSLFGFHSCKRGAATNDLLQGVPAEEIRDKGRWKDEKTLRYYDKRGQTLKKKKKKRKEKSQQ